MVNLFGLFKPYSIEIYFICLYKNLLYLLKTYSYYHLIVSGINIATSFILLTEDK